MTWTSEQVREAAKSLRDAWPAEHTRPSLAGFKSRDQLRADMLDAFAEVLDQTKTLETYDSGRVRYLSDELNRTRWVLAAVVARQREQPVRVSRRDVEAHPSPVRILDDPQNGGWLLLPASREGQ